MWYIIVNPFSGGGKGLKKWKAIEAELQIQHIPYQVVFSDKPQSLTKLAVVAISQHNFKQIVAIGGDGTIHEVICGILEQKAIPSEEITFTAFAGGTGNDWLRSHAIPNQIPKWVEMLKNGKNLPHDIGKIQYQVGEKNLTTYFNNVVGLAYDAYVVEQTANLDKSGFWGQFIYLIYILKYLTQYQSQRVKIQANNYTLQGKAFCINVGICKYSGGGMQTVPLANPRDNLLDLTVIRDMPRWRIIWEMRRLFLGSIYDPTDVVDGRQIPQLSIQHIDEPLKIEADGEYLGHTPVFIETLPNALQIRVSS